MSNGRKRFEQIQGFRKVKEHGSNLHDEKAKRRKLQKSKTFKQRS